MKKKENYNAVAGFVALSQFAGLVGSVFTVNSITNWYLLLNKPFFAPPSWLFGPIWILLYLLMGIAAYLVWRQGMEKKQVRTALIAFGVQLFLNMLWSAIFFGMHNLLLSAIEICILWLSIAWTISEFNKISRNAMLLLTPYILWVSFALILNFAILMLN